MENEEYTEDVDLETENNEEVDETEDTFLDEVDEVEDTDDDVQAELENTKAELETKKAEAAKYRRLLSKKQKEAPQKKEGKSTLPSTDTLSRDEAKLYARGLDDEQVDKVAHIAKLEGLTIDEAYKSDYYTIWNDKREKDAKQEKSQLPASRGGKPTVKKGLDTEGLTEAEHKALMKEKGYL